MILRGSDVNNMVQDQHWLILTFSATDWRPKSCVGNPNAFAQLIKLLLSLDGNMEAASTEALRYSIWQYIKAFWT